MRNFAAENFIRLTQLSLGEKFIIMRTDSIIVKNAHANNLKHVDIELPKHSLVVFTGVSGSGKFLLLLT